MRTVVTVYQKLFFENLFTCFYCKSTANIVKLLVSPILSLLSIIYVPTTYQTISSFLCHQVFSHTSLVVAFCKQRFIPIFAFSLFRISRTCVPKFTAVQLVKSQELNHKTQFLIWGVPLSSHGELCCGKVFPANFQLKLFWQAQISGYCNILLEIKNYEKAQSYKLLGR